MTPLRSWLLRIGAVLVLAIAPMPVMAQADLGRAPLIGIIDSQAVLRESAALQALAQEIEADRQVSQQTMREREESLRIADLDLAQRRARLSSEDYLKERSDLEAEGVSLQRELQAERRRLDQRFSQGVAKVQQVLLSISQEIARERNLDLVLAKTRVIIVKPEFDLTDEALKRLNDRLRVLDPVVPAN